MIKNFKRKDGYASLSIIFEGSNVELPSEFGYAHILEHIICNNLKKLEPEMEKSAIYFNAVTCPIFTKYYIEGLDEKVQQFAQTFYNIITKEAIFKKDILEKEKNIIVQEWAEDNLELESNLLNRFYQNFYHNPRTIGDLDCIKNCSIDKMKKFYLKNFKKPLEIIIEQSSSWNVNPVNGFKENQESIFNFNTQKKTYFPNNNSKTNPMIAFISDSYSSYFAEHQLIVDLLSDGLFSPLFNSLREKNHLIYSLEGDLEFFNLNIAHSKFTTSCSVENVAKIKKEFENILHSKWFSRKMFNDYKEKFLVEQKLKKITNQFENVNQYLFMEYDILTAPAELITYSDTKLLVDNFYKKENFILLK